MKSYKPGLHIISTFEADEHALTEMMSCQRFFNRAIREFDLSKVGESYHQFDNGGFTATVCLTESHLSIHTWPEYGIATFDIFLSNFRKDNTDKVRSFYIQTLDHFKGRERNKHEIIR